MELISTNPYLWRVIHRVDSSVEDAVAYSVSQPQIFGFVGVIGFPLFYYIWHELYPQSFNSITLSSVGWLMALIATQLNRLETVNPLLLKVIWLVICTYCLPFFFTYMLLKNNCNIVWSMSAMAGLTLLVLVVYDWLLATFMYIVGSIAALSLYTFSSSYIGALDLYITQTPIYFFVVIAGGLFSHRSATIRHAKLKSLASVGAELGHELRTPLLSLNHHINIVEQYSRKLSRYSSGQSTVNVAGNEASLNVVKNSIFLMQREIKHANTIIDMFLLDLGNQNIYEQEFTQQSAYRCVEVAVGRFPFASEQERQKVKLDLETDFTYFGSDLLLIHVLFNLIKNALAHLDNQGQVCISIRGGEGGNLITVRDTGSGIAAKNLAYIFDEFYTSASSHGGTGIGLAFCKKVMNHFKGKIGCESELGCFTEFRLSFPSVTDKLTAKYTHMDSDRREHRPSLSQENHRDLSGVVLLLVDDHKINYQHICVLLMPFGIEVHYAMNGSIAVGMLEESHYDAVVMDVQMPHADGCEVTKGIRSGKGFSVFSQFRTIPIIGMSGDPRPQVLTRCLNAGFNTLIHKPVKQSLLLDILIERLGFSESIMASGESQRSKSYVSLVEPLAPEARFLHDILTPLLLIETANTLLKEATPVLLAHYPADESVLTKAQALSVYSQVSDDIDQQISLIRSRIAAFWIETRSVFHLSEVDVLRERILTETGRQWREIEEMLSTEAISTLPELLDIYRVANERGISSAQKLSQTTLQELQAINGTIDSAIKAGGTIFRTYCEEGRCCVASQKL